MTNWQTRLDTLRAACHVPGASLAVLADGEIHEWASGVLHRGTGVEATTDSVYQLGSVAKVYTATLVMTLVEEGKLDLDAPVVDVLPEFATADPGATKVITPRQLLSHTGGLTCDFMYDGGRGDDCLANYVRAARGVAMDCPPGVAVSYSGVGYVTLGRIVEVLTGRTWDEALKERVFRPLGLTHSMTLPEEALSFRAAMSHLGEPGAYPEPAPAWDLIPRASGPGARVIASAGDVVRLAGMHLGGGAAVLRPETVAAMQQRQVDVPDKWTVSADGWGLGWTLYDWDGRFGYGHDGAAVGQYAYLRVIPDAGVAIALTTNGGGARRLYAELFRELLEELAGITMPEPFGPAGQPPAVGIGQHAGTYRREGVLITVTEDAHLTYEFVDGMKDLSPPIEAELVPVSETVWAATGAGPSFSEGWMPVVFAELDGHDYCYIGMRAAPRI
ncbi:serine hydrolase domain-containing protein [Cryptosporangium japonicum]|uniref:Beta-lactamase-related domain-containing protein n=1 Tax=Cryptosporangium japonicum TaxID=80872 RepID=A0ABN0VBE3_9ACTN